ncbi:MAG TPA: isoprenylcysteine carboxylmethyltransferase family protein [Solirubrobacteraceae bacterium]|nr:isoprenylcysteine carboxylmethyltransferase family protein [Solirubrobacteraceae bacterium]
MPDLALLLWALYGAAALGWRVAVQLRRTGKTGLIAARVRPFSVAGVADLGQAAGIVLGVTAALLAHDGALEPVEALDRTAVHVAGLALFAAGLSGTVASQAAMGRSWRIGTDPQERTDLVTGGPFRLVRNPIYSALIPTLLGLALLVPGALALGSVAVFALATELQVRAVEEPHLLRVHGREYADYAARVGRFVPGVGRLARRRD